MAKKLVSSSLFISRADGVWHGSILTGDRNPKLRECTISGGKLDSK